MEYHLEREVRLSTESEYENLYKWSLQEYDKNGKQVGEKQVPWEWSLYFTASELRHNRSIEYKELYDLDEEGKKGISEKETITGIMHSGFLDDGKRLEDHVHYSFFGTNRIIKQFYLHIYKFDDASDNEEDKKECCALSGIPSYTTEVDFQDEITEDVLEISMLLSPERFDKLSELITLKRVDMFTLILARVPGFYSRWSPSFLTRDIKILPRGSESVVVIPENCKIEPPRLGEVGEFSLSITQRNAINLKQDLQGVDINKIFEDE